MMSSTTTNPSRAKVLRIKNMNKHRQIRRHIIRSVHFASNAKIHAVEKEREGSE